MHMLMVIIGGIVLLGVFGLFGKLWGGNIESIAIAAKVFIPVWLAISLTNMWVGVTKAGYTVMQELPILFVVFALPVIMAVLINWQLTKS